MTAEAEHSEARADRDRKRHDQLAVEGEHGGQTRDGDGGGDVGGVRDSDADCSAMKAPSVLD